MKFLPNGESIATRIRDLVAFEKKEPIRLAVSYWGKGSETLVVKPHRIICDLESGACNPYVIEEIWRMSPASIRMQSGFHAKVVVASDGAVISSANMSINGLGLNEGIHAGNSEAGVYIDPENSEYCGIVRWFESEWDLSREISNADLSAAAHKWARRQERMNRPAVLEKLDPDALLLKGYQGDSVLRSVKAPILQFCTGHLGGLSPQKVGKVASAAVHLMLNMTEQSQSYKTGARGNASYSIATDAWITNHVKKIDINNAQFQVAKLLAAFGGCAIIPNQGQASRAISAAARGAHDKWVQGALTGVGVPGTDTGTE